MGRSGKAGLGCRVTDGISCGHHLMREVREEHLARILGGDFVTVLCTREMRHVTSMSMMQRPARGPQSGESQERSSKEDLQGRWLVGYRTVPRYFF